MMWAEGARTHSRERMSTRCQCKSEKKFKRVTARIGPLRPTSGECSSAQRGLRRADSDRLALSILLSVGRNTNDL
jgi:hypothetical protein